MLIGLAGLALIMAAEGFSPTLYDDPGNNCTIGYGHLLHRGPCNGDPTEAPYTNGITKEDATALLMVQLQSYGDCVTANSRPLNQNEYDALTSFCYNVGKDAYVNSNVRNAVNNGGDVRLALSSWVHDSTGQPLPGLINRRANEANLFYTPEVDMTQDEVNALFDQRLAADVYPKIGAELAALGQQGAAIVATANALVNHIATHPGGGATNTMAADLADMQAKIQTLEDEAAAFDAKIKAIGAAANGPQPASGS